MKRKLSEDFAELRGSKYAPRNTLLASVNAWIEAIARGVLVNVPMYLLSIDEFDSVCTMTMAYLLMQIVGFIWAFLVNAAFSLACRSSVLLPHHALPVSTQSSSSVPIPPQQPSYFDSLQLIAAFYVSYASIRVVFGFAQSVFQISLESIKSFPTAAKKLSQGGKLTLHLIPIVFIPPFILQLSLIFADRMCSHPDNLIVSGICSYSGISYLRSSTSPVLRRLILYSIFLVVIQLWQAALQQFPNWQNAFKSLSKISRLCFQVAMLLLALTSSSFTFFVLFFSHSLQLEGSRVEETLCAVLFGWTLWLFAFIPVLVAVHGDTWERETKRVWEPNSVLPFLSPTPKPLSRDISRSSLISGSSEGTMFDVGISNEQYEQLNDTVERNENISTDEPMKGGNDLRVFAGFLRLSHVLLLLIFFAFACFHSGYPEAQLLLTFLTIVVPALYCLTYLFCSIAIKAGLPLMLFGTPVALLFATGATKLAQSVGNGSMILVFVHAINKGVQFFCEEDEEEDEGEVDPGYMDSSNQSGEPTSNNSTPSKYSIEYDKSELSIDRENSNNATGIAETAFSTEHKKGEPSMLKKEKNVNAYDQLDGGLDKTKRVQSAERITGATQSSLRRNLSQSDASVSSTLPHRHPYSLSSFGEPRDCCSSGALSLLEERGMRHSALVSVIPKNVKEHWLVLMSKRNMRFVFDVTRKLAVSDSILSGVIRLFAAMGVICTLILATISLASYAQMSLKIFPKLIDFTHNRENNSILFNHRISNVTLHLASQSSSWRKPHETCSNRGLEHPHYAACSWRWLNSLSLLDFSLISELAYFDDPGSGGLQKMVDSLFPPSHGFDFVVRASPMVSSGPMYLELHSAKLDTTIVGIRGTDVGRLRDFMEDVNLYAEPVVHSLLSAVFPTIRLWTHDTTSRIIEWLFDVNSFFGLQGEAEYYRSLTERVVEISGSGTKVIITGHSLGGGLARIVGTLTGLPSVSFSPPGLKLSYRKYSAHRPDGTVSKVQSTGALHHESVTVVTDFDWITQIDVQVGLVQQILCDHEQKSHQNSCHLLEGTICHLLKHCGDPRERFIAPFCESTYDVSAIYPSIYIFAYEHRLVLVPVFLLICIMILFAVIPEIM